MDKIFMGLPSNPALHAQYLQDNSDAVEKQSYSKSLTAEELNEVKENICILTQQINDLQEEKKDYDSTMTAKIKSVNDERKPLLDKFANKTEYVTELCYKVIDHEERQVGFYNNRGELVYQRPLQAQELQKTIQMELRKEGTND